MMFTVLFFVFTFTSAYYGGNKIVIGTIQIGELDFSIINNLSTITTEETNLFMPGEYIDNAVSIINARDIAGTNTQNLGSFYLKLKPILENIRYSRHSSY